MAEVDARSARGTVAAPITAFAFGKLSTMAANHRQQAAGGDLIDAFAEVFASMSQTSASLDSPKSFVPDSSADQTSRTNHDRQPSGDASTTQAQDGNADDSSVPAQDDGLDSQLLGANGNDEPNESEWTGSVAQANAFAQSVPKLDTADASDEAASQADIGMDATGDADLDSVIRGEAIRKQQRGQNEFASREAAGEDRPLPQESVHDADERQAIARDAAETTAKAESLGKVGDSSDPLANPSDSGDNESRGDRRRQPTDREANPVGTQSSNAAQRVPSKANVNTPAIASEAVSGALASSSADASPTIPASNPTSQSTATINQIQSVATALTGADSVSGARTTVKGIGPAADVNDASQVTSRPATTSSRAGKSASDVVARIKLIQRVSKAFQHLGSEGGSVRIRLAPAELGSVRVEMHVRDRQVKARVVADNETASSALREHLPELRARLESYGLKVEQLEVETETANHGLDARQESDSRWQPPQQQRDSDNRSFTTPPLRSARVEADASASHTDSTTTILRSANRGVDVRL